MLEISNTTRKGARNDTTEQLDKAIEKLELENALDILHREKALEKLQRKMGSGKGARKVWKDTECGR